MRNPLIEFVAGPVMLIHLCKIGNRRLPLLLRNIMFYAHTFAFATLYSCFWPACQNKAVLGCVV
jgi:hypothetical protein